jgi:hypothetical protein
VLDATQRPWEGNCEGDEWNVENLFRPGADGGPDSQTVYEDKLGSLAGTIDAHAPDLIAL